MKILLAEDDPHIAVIAKLSLSELGGHAVDHAADGATALQMALAKQYDVILLDEMMPKMSGLQVCREYLEKSPTPAPIIFLSAKSQDSDVAEFRSIGLGFIPKPFDPTQLSRQIIEILKARRTQQRVA